MSNPLQRRSRAARGSLIWTGALLGLLSLAGAKPAFAQRTAIEAWAQWAVGQGRWAGPVVPHPDRVTPSDSGLYVIRSWLRPLAVHAPEVVPFSTAQAALSALEYGYDALLASGWPEPFPDGGYGNTADFDLYLRPSDPLPADAHVRAPVSWSHLDGAAVFAEIDPNVENDRLESCVIDAYAQAVLLGQDPAEAPSWRRATGAYVSWLITGHFGCEDEVAAQQQNPWRAWISDAPESGAGGALFLAMLSEREDGGSGAFVRDLWQFARQRTAESGRLRASPDLWEAAERALANAGESLDEIAVNFAVARYFAGTEERRSAAPYPSLRSLGPNAEVPISDRVPFSKLPEHLPVSVPPVETFGSRFTLIDTSEAPVPTRLEIWLRGEYGARWSLVAVRLAGDGREIGRTSAPATRNPDNFLAVELTEPARSVLVVVTNLGSGRPDADRDTRNGRAFRLIVDADRAK